ncbi:ATP:cob(I)alamin adenosyltransferase [Moraxella caviae]|uniref:Corrinoid adenosyltransferase n=2 Tax=Moraxella caviae TaxID=34060 RepID=A0A1S9ZVT4_9GAMM|nr:ATP:cob(I)alamin adenosyltransferase [Moraxella caviae]STZ10063.1 Cob(I)yrinic acid a,c-diamide adenosyltransferase [Moraxella caviae]VEW12746.1 Cob(I)yrinic acid a,c-diamide adenosyltransferase [Moraxella caviae]
MGNRLSKIYTRTGDDGTSGLADGSRLAKDDAVFMAMGDVDELNSHIGMIDALLDGLDAASAHFDTKAVRDELNIISHLLFNVGGELAMPEFIGIHDTHISWLEARIDKMNDNLPYLKDFILLKGSVLICQIHIARSVARRAERSCITLAKRTSIRPTITAFVNRLSDYLFVLSRFVTPDNKVNETLWNAKVLGEL